MFNRSPKAALLAIVGIYLVILGGAFLFYGAISDRIVLLPLIPALVLGLVVSGHLRLVNGGNGIQFVDARRSPASVAAAQRSQASGPQVNINGLPMANGVDVHGNPYGSTLNDPR